MKSGRRFGRIIALFLAFALAVSAAPLTAVSAVSATSAVSEDVTRNDPDKLPDGYVDNSNDGMFQLQGEYEKQQSETRILAPGDGAVKKVEIAFLIDASGSMAPYIAKVKENVTAFAQHLESQGVDLRMAVIRFGSTADRTRATVMKINESSWHTSTAQLVQTLSGIPANGGTEALSDAVGDMLHDDPATSLPNIYWSSDAYKFAFVLTNDFDTGVQGTRYNDYGYQTLDSTVPDLQSYRIPVTVVTQKNYFPRYVKLTNETGGELYDISTANYSELLIDYAESVLGIALRATKAIYVLPGYLGSELYDGSDGTGGGTRLWFPENVFDLDTILHQDNLRKFYQDENSGGTQLHVEYPGDDYGTMDTYKALVDRLKSDFSAEYDVRFFPYNWLEDLNDSATKLESDINRNGYADVVFVTHSTGGLLASAYISRSSTNKLKVSKAILIAAPLYGTYASLLPLERGDSRKTGNFLSQDFWIDFITSNDWIRGWAKNSPTTYQLLPSTEYLAWLPLQDKRGWFDGEETITSANGFYSVLNQSNNVNPKLTNGSNKSHKYFRETTLHGDIVNQWSIASLLEVDTLLVGTSYGHSTTSVAVYNEPLVGTHRQLKDIQYNKNGDGTIQGFSAKGEKKGGASPLRTDFSFTSDHGGLVGNSDVLNTISGEIKSLSTSPSETQIDADQANSEISNAAAAVTAGMSEYIKIRYTASQPIKATVFNASGEIVATAAGDKYSGFDGNDFIYDSFATGADVTEANIYMPNAGYRVEFSCGDAAGQSVDFSAEVSTLAADGWKDVSVTHSANVTAENGVVSLFDGTAQAIVSGNIAEVITGTVQTHYKDWDLPGVLKVNIGESQQLSLLGVDANQVLPLLRWTSADESIVSVSSGGVLTANNYGRTTVAASDGNRASVAEIVVVQNASSVELSDISMVVGERTLIRPKFTPASSTESDMSYSLSENGIISISAQGVIRAIKAGTVTVTGSTSYGVQDIFTVVVKDNRIYSVQSIELSPAAASLAPEGTADFNAIIKPDNATNKNVNWFVSDSSVISLVANNGSARVTGLKEGTTKITAVSTDGGYTAEATVTVAAVKSITVTATAGTGGTVSGGGTFVSGASVRLTATPGRGYSFDGWYESGSKINGAGSVYSFSATASRSLQARFTPVPVPVPDNDGGGGGSGGGGGGGGNPTTVNATVNVSEAAFDKSAAKDITVTLYDGGNNIRNIRNGAYNLVRNKDYTVIGNVYTIKADYLKTLKNGGTSLVFDMSGGTDPSFLVSVFGEAERGDDSILLNGRVSGLRLNADGSVTVTSVDIDGLAAPVLLTVPYEGAGVTHVGVLRKSGGSGGEDGDVIIPFSVPGSITMLISEPGTYGGIDNKKNFTDTSGHWAETTIDFIAAREIYSGVGNDLFDPDGKMTRAMFATVLANLEKADLSGYSKTEFTDVDMTAWYGAPVAWAVEEGILSGYGGGLFGPNDLITREQTALVLSNYMKYKDIALTPEDGYTPFVDDDSVSSWAKEAVVDMKRYGLIAGIGNNTFSPKDTANRAGVAQIFRNFIEAYITK